MANPAREPRAAPAPAFAAWYLDFTSRPPRHAARRGSAGVSSHAGDCQGLSDRNLCPKQSLVSALLRPTGQTRHLSARGSPLISPRRRAAGPGASAAANANPLSATKARNRHGGSPGGRHYYLCPYPYAPLTTAYPSERILQKKGVAIAALNRVFLTRPLATKLGSQISSEAAFLLTATTC